MGKSHYEYIAVFQSKIVDNFVPTKFIIDDIKIEIFNEERAYKIPFIQDKVIPNDNSNHTLSHNELLSVSKQDGYNYISLTARTKEEDPFIQKIIFQKIIDRTIIFLSMLKSPLIFSKQIYRGFLITDSINEQAINCKFTFDGEYVLSNTYHFGDDTVKYIQKYMQSIQSDPDINNRFTLMSKFYAKSLIEKMNEEKFIWLWTILEIFPMKDTSNIQPISDYLANIMKKDAETVKDKLNIGRIYGKRCDLVHDGNFNITQKDLSIFFTKLDLIVQVILKSLCGIPYNGELDKYFN